MKKTILLFVLSILTTTQLWTQSNMFKVQGIPRPDLHEKVQKSSPRLQGQEMRLSDEANDYSKFTFDSIKFWVGNGTNQAALIIDWYDGKGTQTARVWGYRWHKDSVRTGFDMVKAIAKADKRFMLLTHTTNLGNTIAGLGYDLNNSGNQSLIFGGNTEHPHIPVNGVVTTTEYNYDDWKSSDVEDHWQAGWYDGYWSYQVKEADEADFSYSGVGASSRILKNGSCDGWGYADMADFGGGTLPRMPFFYAPSPYLPFPNYTAYWPQIRKDTLSHMPIVALPLAIKQDSLIEKWKLSGIGSGFWASGGQALVVNNSLYLAYSNKLKIINRETGETIKEATMAADAGFFAMMAYGEGKIFVPLGNGVLQAFRADNLEPIWKTKTVGSNQQLCEVTYHDGYVYTGMWKTIGSGIFYCVKAEDEDPSNDSEIKPYIWESFNQGFYWSGGTIVDNAIIFGGDMGTLESRDRLTGEFLDSLQITGTIRCGASYDKENRRIFFTAKEEGKVYSVKVNIDGSFDKTSLKSGNLSGEATTVPVLYNGRLYITSGTMSSRGGLDIVDASTLTKIYSANIGGISQATPLVSTGYASSENKNTVYIYVTLNNPDGSIVCVKDFEGNTESIVKYSKTPSSKQYCTQSLVTDEQGTIYYKNDGGALIAYTSKPTYEVDGITLNIKEKTLTGGDKIQLTANVLPLKADNKNVSWTSSNTSVASVSTNGLVTALSVGETKIIVNTEDGNFSDTCMLSVGELNYSNGVFFVNEDWYGHNNGTINFLDDNGNWHYRVYQKENPGKELGATSQYGTIYGNKLFIVSKQDQDPSASIKGSRLAVCNAATMESLAEFASIGDADGRSFLGVNEHKGYIGTSNGIYVFDIDNLTIGKKLKGTENTSGSLYSGQIGTMIQAAGKVFAVNQKTGVLVINTETDEIEAVIAAPKDGSKQRGFGSIVQSKDGNLWLSVATNTSGSGSGEEYLLKLNPYTLDTTRISLPKGGSIPNSWYAWTADGFCTSTQHNKLYWKNNGGWFSSTKIFEYDIEKNTFRTVFDSEVYEPSQRWGIYGAGFRLDPRTDDIYVSLYKDFGSSIYKVVKVNLEGGKVISDYPMDENYWFPAMPVFPDKHAPIVSEDLIDLSIKEETKIYLGDKVSDMDNMQVSIVKSIASISNTAILVAVLKNDSLIISPIGGQTGISSINLKFNSNGKIITKTITIKVETLEIPIESVELDTNTLDLKVNETYQLIATVLPENATNKNVRWESSNLSVAIVENGLVSALSQGEATITVTSLDGKYAATCLVNVYRSVGVNAFEKNICQVYPTVTTGTINIVQEKLIEQIQILDISGKLVQTIHLKSLEATIDLSFYKSGVYLVKIGAQMVKIIKR